MIDGRIKPDITAPGITIATSSSSYDTAYTPTGSAKDYVIARYTDATSSRDFYYSEFSGTSASAPAASGIVALLLRANPTLTPDQLKTILFETAITDVHTGVIPTAGNNNWGHGKINAYKALKRVVQEAGVYTYTGTRPDCVLFPNPSGGSFAVDYTGSRVEQVSVTVNSIAGAIVYSKLWQIQAGINRLPVALSNVAKGMYVVKIQAQDGTATIKTTIR